MGWKRLIRRAQWDRERASEMASYLEMETAWNQERGMSAEAAHHAAQRKLGNTTLIREEIYRMNTITFVETLWQDLQYAIRALRKSPAFAAVAILSLALGIGANTAVFSLVHAVLLRPLPYAQADRLMLMGQKFDRSDGTNLLESEFLKEHGKSFAATAAFRGPYDSNLQYAGAREWIASMPVAEDFFRTLGVKLAMGREFNADETRPGGTSAIILSDGLWRRMFGSDREVLGRAATIGGTTYSVIGVAPAGFWFPQAADAFVPLRLSGTVGDEGRNNMTVARVKQGISLRQAEAEMPALTAAYLNAYPRMKTPEYAGMTPIPFRDWIVGNVGLKLLLLFGATGLLLLIACSNLASLLLARLEQRQKEIAVRLALGSSRGRLLRQFVMENMLLCVAGAFTGILGAAWLLKAIVALFPFHLPASAPIRLDPPVLAFTVAIALATALLFCLAPLLASSRVDLHGTLKSGGRSTGSGPVRQRARTFLVVGQVALSVTLLVSAALLVESLYRLNHERLGFSPRGLLTFWAPPPTSQGRSPAELWAYQSTLIARLRGLPGVHSVAAINNLPLTNQNNFPVEPQGRPQLNIGGMEIRVVTPAYFEAMSIPIVRGRALELSDGPQSEPVILVNETVAHRWWPATEPLGDHVIIGRFRGKDLSHGFEHPRAVVGVVADTKTVDLKKPPKPTVYIASAQSYMDDGGMAWVLRADRPSALAEQVRRAVMQVEPRQRVQRMRTMEDLVDSTTAESRFDAWLFGVFAALALMLTAIGVYGLLSFAVARRTNEIGTRMALGATRGNVLLLVLRQGLLLTGIGLLVGLGGAVALTRSMTTLLYGVRASDPVSFTVVAVLLLAVGALASYLPARRAMKVDPMVALRYE
jgi:putative ABC transport system permease protein